MRRRPARVIQEVPKIDHHALSAAVVGDGDEVRAIGQLAGSSEDGWELRRYFASRRVPRRARLIDNAIGGPDHLIVLTGPVDATLAGSTVEVRGRFHTSHLDVAEMARRRRPTVLDLPPRPLPSSCPPPPGGWQSPDGTSDLHLPEALNAYLADHAEHINDPWVSYDHDGPPYPNAEGGAGPVPVLAVGTTGSVERARRDLTALYPGPICVYQVSAGRSELDKVRGEIEARFADRCINARGLSLDAPDRAVAMVTWVTAGDAAALAHRSHLIHVQPRISPITS